MADSDSSDLSEHDEKEIQKLFPIFAKAAKATKSVAPPPVVSPPRKREPSPPHEEVLADDPAIAQIVAFRARFNDVMPAKLQNLGPQDIERGVVDSTPSPQVEQLLCTLLALVLNRKKPVERGHHGRALEEAVLSQKSQWPYKWKGVNPLHGGKSFENMTPKERLDLLRTLMMWALTSSEAIQATLKEKYKQQRHNDDENQPLSVQPWGVDGDKRRYFLIQGLDDTGFRVYREGSRYTKNAHWFSMAGDIDEVKALATKLEEVDRSQAARRLASKITNAIPMFEATEEKRRRREYRQMRRAAFSRPEPGFSLYEGRTRGKRMRYTYDDDDQFESDATSTRRSARQSARNTPFDSGPTVTASGRQVRQPRTGDYGESLLSGAATGVDDLGPDDSEGAARSGTEDSEQPVTRGGRAMRSAARPALNGLDGSRKRKHIETYNGIDEWSDEEEADEWDSDKNETEDERMPDADDEEGDDMSEADEESEDEDDEPRSLVVRLRVSPKVLSRLQTPGIVTPVENGASSPLQATGEATTAGAPTCEQGDQVNTASERVEAPQLQQQWSSPTGPSAYPTPTSSSFLPPEQKAAVAPLPSITERESMHPATNNLPVTNGVAPLFTTKPETEPEAKPTIFAHPLANGVPASYEDDSAQP